MRESSDCPMDRLLHTIACGRAHCQYAPIGQRRRSSMSMVYRGVVAFQCTRVDVCLMLRVRWMDLDDLRMNSVDFPMQLVVVVRDGMRALTLVDVVGSSCRGFELDCLSCLGRLAPISGFFGLVSTC